MAVRQYQKGNTCSYSPCLILWSFLYSPEKWPHPQRPHLKEKEENLLEAKLYLEIDRSWASRWTRQRGNGMPTVTTNTLSSSRTRFGTIFAIRTVSKINIAEPVTVLRLESWWNRYGKHLPGEFIHWLTLLGPDYVIISFERKPYNMHEKCNVLYCWRICWRLWEDPQNAPYVLWNEKSFVKLKKMQRILQWEWDLQLVSFRAKGPRELH